jgi:hypothetical protein
MPVLLAGRYPNGVARFDLADRSAPCLNAPNARNHMKGLSERMGMPCRAGAGIETDTHCPDAGGLRRLDDRVLPDGACKPIRVNGFCRVGS